MKKLKHNKKGMGTVEIVIIIAVLVGLALVFRDGLMRYGQSIMNYCFNDQHVISSL